jgi:hypothetical protein
MSVGSVGGRSEFNSAVSSGLDSVSSGISKSIEGGTLKADVIEQFRISPRDPALITSPRDPAFQISTAAQIPAPGIFFSNLPAAHKDESGIKAKELADKLRPGNLDLKKSVDDLKNSFQEEIKKREEELNSVGDDAQLANVDLQNILQKQQQTLQMMSNISKMLYDTAQSVIRKMGG